VGIIGIDHAGHSSDSDQQVFGLIFNGTPITIGEATARAKAAVTNGDVRRTWILLGDRLPGSCDKAEQARSWRSVDRFEAALVARQGDDVGGRYGPAMRPRCG